jgi:VanZ family protein
MLQPDDTSKTTRFRRLAAFARYATVGLLLAMFIGTHLPASTEVFLANSDKMLHFCAYFSLAMFLLVSGELTLGDLQPIHFFSVWLGCTIYGALDEITQILVGRDCDIADWVFDVMGIVGALTVFRIVRPLVVRLAVLMPAFSRVNS